MEQILKFFRNIFFDKHEYEIGELKYNKVKELAHFYSVENVHFSMFYNNYFRDMIYELKYKRKKYVAKAIYSIIQEQLDFIIKANQIDYIICVPTSKKREKERSFNQVELIYHNLPYKFLKIKKIRDTKKMSKLQKTYQKNLNISKSFNVGNLNLSNKTVLVVDDIITTGATIREIEKELRLKYVNLKIVFYAVAISKKFINKKL